MRFDGAAKGLAIRERVRPPPARSVVRCPRCGGTNPSRATRCRSCFSQLPSKAASPPATPAAPVPRTVEPTIDTLRSEVDSILGELEALTKEDDAAPVQFQCPRCRRIVGESATQCACGAVFGDSREVVRYECPMCGTPVPKAATRCRCGTRFAD